MTLRMAVKLWLCAIFLTAVFFIGIAQAAPQVVGEMLLTLNPSQQAQVSSNDPLFGKYLGYGKGSGTSALAGSIVLDLYEDQSREDFHPAYMRGYVEQNGARHTFQLIGVFILKSSKPATSAECAGSKDPHCISQVWQLEGTIVFDDSQLLGQKQALVTGVTTLDSGSASGKYRVWIDMES